MNGTELQPRKNTRLLSALFVLPILFLLPTSITFLVMNDRLAEVSGGQDSPEFTDIAIRWGMSGGLDIFIALTVIGSILWLVAFGLWVGLIVRDRKAHWPKALALLIGFTSHLAILGRIWQ